MSQQLQEIGIIGTGMIGTSLMVLTTGHGVKTTVLAVNDELAAASRKQFDKFYADLVTQGLMTAEQAAVCAEYLTYTTNYDDLCGAELVFECVVEKLDVKHEVYATLEAACPKLKAICSVSSAIVVDDLASGMGKYKDRIIVTHPFNPPHLVPFFELATGASTDPAVVECVVGFLRFLDRKPVVLKKSAPGFIGNRLQFALWREALNIVDQGIANPEDVDTCLMYSFCPRYTSIGMFEHFDNGGLDLNLAVSKALFPVLSDAKEVSSQVTDRVARGDLGIKTGKGFFDWAHADLDAFRARVSAPFWHFFNWSLPKK